MEKYLFEENNVKLYADDKTLREDTLHGWIILKV